MNNTYFVFLDCVYGNCIFPPWKSLWKLHCLSEFVPRASYDLRGTNISAAPFYSATVLSRDCRSVSRETASCGYWKSFRKYEYVFCVLIRKHSAPARCIGRKWKPPQKAPEFIIERQYFLRCKKYGANHLTINWLCSSAERCDLLDISKYISNHIIIKSDKLLRDKSKNGANLVSIYSLLFIKLFSATDM